MRAPERRSVLQIARARELREDHTEVEARLWQIFKARRLAGAKFRRHHPIGPYVLDFYCPKARLCVELDGSGHAEPEQVSRDEARTRFLRSLGITVLRFWNPQVLQEQERVLNAIVSAMEEASAKGRLGVER